MASRREKAWLRSGREVSKGSEYKRELRPKIIVRVIKKSRSYIMQLKSFTIYYLIRSTENRLDFSGKLSPTL